jgi:hypothetical protein
MDSQAGFAERVEAGGSEQSAAFRFSVTWSYLFAPVAGLKRTETLMSPNLSTSNVRAGELPVTITADRSNSVAAISQSTATPEQARITEPSIPNLYTALSFYPRLQNGWKLLLGAALLGALVVPIWRALPSRSKVRTVNVETNTLGGGWRRESAFNSEPGADQARQLVLYQPSLGATNGQIEFTWKVDDRGVGWIFRAKDIANYYAMRMKVLKPAPSLTLSVEHFSVQFGEVSSHSEKVLALPRNDSALRLKLDAAGPSFTLYLQGNAVDYWTDTRLTAGAFGFYEERGQAANVLGVRMSFSRWAHAQLQGLPAVNRESVTNSLSAVFVNTNPASGGA